MQQLERQPIHYGSAGGHLDLVCELIEQYGVDPNTIDSVCKMSNAVAGCYSNMALFTMHSGRYHTTAFCCQWQPCRAGSQIN